MAKTNSRTIIGKAKENLVSVSHRGLPWNLSGEVTPQNGLGYLLTGVWLMGSVACVFRFTRPEMPPPSPASSDGSTGMVPLLWLCL
jgi:hypothetical protein